MPKGIKSITVCKAYQTSDGAVHQTREEALKWEFKLAIQGVFNRNGSRTQLQFSPREVADILMKNIDEVQPLVKSFSFNLKSQRSKAAAKEAQQMVA